MRNYFRLITICTLCLVFLTNISIAQDKKLPTPREETLLNGLKVLILTQPDSGRVSVKLRIHSGSAFDPADKEGTMTLLSDIIFPNEAIKTYFEEDLDGKLEIISTYDYIQINATAKSAEFLAVMETLAPAVSSPQIDKETLAKLKPNRLEMLKQKENDASDIADRLIAERLYGEFPYGRPQTGTPESIAAIDFADLIFARQKFLTADNATLVISGDVNSNYAYKAARRLFGGWQKSLSKVPANFRLPEAPESPQLTVNTDEGDVIEYRLAIDTVDRNDQDYYATKILVNAWQEKYCNGTNFILNPYLLRGILLIKQSEKISKNNDDLPINSNKCEFFGLASQPDGRIELGYITKEQFTKSKEKIYNEFNANLSNPNNAAELWLDNDTYKIKSMSSELKKLNDTDFKDVQNAYNKIAKSFRDKKYAFISVVPTPAEPKIEQMNDPKEPK